VRKESIRARNVLGFIKGADPNLRDEYVLLTAHYDHIGTGKATGTSTDTIFNGARDNAMGTVALIAAAKSFAAQPPKRSVIIAAVTGEEIGEFGSRYLASNLPVPTNQVVFDLNSDGAGYDDTTIVTVVGLERTTAETAIRQGSERYGLKAVGDPVPEQHLFDRSDNTNFARLGIPAPTYSEGFRSFGPEILKYYHQAADQADDSLNFSYFTNFCKAYVHSARLIADMKEKPFWKSGDEYEKAGKALYGSERKQQR
jgi:Zn-dependent M28 family amino/carboxypeptidase